jgi:hypothetical protein
MKKATLTFPQRKSFVSRRNLESLGLLGPVLLLFACGGSSMTTSAGAGAASMSGTASYGGSMSNAVVKAFAISNGAVGAQLASSTTDAQGNFTVAMGDYSGGVMLQVSEGTFTDDATGASMTMQPADVMTSVVPSVAAGSSTAGIQVTPITSMAQARAQNMAGGMTDGNIAAANAAMASYFAAGDILHTPPMNPQAPGSAMGANQDAKDYGMTIAAMSEYAASLGMPHSSGIITAMMEDASDGVLDGMMAGTPISMNGMGGMVGGGTMQPAAASTELATAMTQFMASAMNRSGLAPSDMQALITQLGGSSGQMPGMGGGGSSGGTVGGTVVYGPMTGGSMAAFAVSNGMMGAQLASAAVDSNGNFTMSIGSYSGPVMLRMTGGTYTDDATGTTMTMQPGDAITAALPTVAAGSTTPGVQVTPLTSMAQARAQNMSGGMTDANIASANAAMANYFSVGDILHTTPMNPLMPGSGASATQDAKNYGMSIAAMSEYAKTIGMTTSSGIVTAMMDDATDGIMNGMMGSTPISMSGLGGMGGGMMGGGSMMQGSAGTSGMAAAMTAFIDDTTVNRSGVLAADMQALIAKLGASSGALQ